MEEGEVAENERRGEEPADDLRDDVDESAEHDAGRVDTLADDSADAKEAKRERVGLFGRLGRFFREIVAELRKVIWPTRKELITYTGVVIVFVSIMTAIVVGLDFAFAKGVLALFGK